MRHHSDLDLLWESWASCILGVAREVIGTRKVRVGKAPGKIWWTAALDELVEAKHRAYNRWTRPCQA